MIQPLANNVVLKTIKQEEKTKSGLVLSTDEKDHPNIGEVLAVGPGLYEDGDYLPMSVKKKDRVIFKQYSTTEITLDNEKYLIIKESDILGKLEE